MGPCATKRTSRPTVLLFLAVLLLLLPSGQAWARDVRVADDASLRRALAEARPGWRILIAPGTYRPEVRVRELRGTAEAPIVIEAADPKDKPVFVGGGVAFQFSDCSYLTLRNLAVRGQTGNGLNIDDGGSFDTPAHHITLEGIEVLEIGPRGNRDGIKLSGIDDLVLRGCRIEAWAGQGMDMVGCHRVLIEGCLFRGRAGFDQGAGVQAKGGSSQVVVRNCVFLNAGQRPVNLGGSTDLRVFRPQGAKYEAKDITVEGCRFVGGVAPVSYVGVDGAVVRYNTIVRPDKWVARILQETNEPGFVPSRNGRFERNLVVYRRAQVAVHVNVGSNTEPGSFRFAENLWYCEDAPARSRPALPTPEQAGVYGVDPGVKLDETGVPGAPANPAAKGYGADALPKPAAAPGARVDGGDAGGVGGGGAATVAELIRQPWFRKAPPLPEPAGQVIRVTSVEELFRAAEAVKPGGTILVADGRYEMPRYFELRTDDVTLRGESGDRDKVILDGARSRHGELVGITGCSGVTIADLTIQNVRHNGFKINSDRFATKVTIYNCVIRNVWERGVKGPMVRPEDRGRFRPSDCRIMYCLFYNDRPKRFEDDPSDTAANFGGNYVGGIDAMYARRWVISDNVFVGIQGRTRGARGAVFLWHESEDCVVERNVIIDCDSGICLGNSHKPADVPVHARRCVVRNNFVTRCPEQGILADYTEGCRIVHNTVHDPASRFQRLIRLVHDNEGMIVANNLLSGPPMRVETTSRIAAPGNVTRAMPEAFVDVRRGDLHLRPQAAAELAGAGADAVELGVGVLGDIDGDTRRDRRSLVGADEVPAR